MPRMQWTPQDAQMDTHRITAVEARKLVKAQAPDVSYLLRIVYDAIREAAAAGQTGIIDPFRDLRISAPGPAELVMIERALKADGYSAMVVSEAPGLVVTW